jgi:hypothetical protein
MGFVNNGRLSRSALGLIGTRSAKADELKFMSDDLEIGALFESMGNADTGLRRRIEYPVTVKAANVVMFFSYAVISFQAAAQLQLLNFAAIGQNFEVSIHRSKADAGHAFADHFIDLISAGMRSDVSKLFQDNLTLACHPEV